MYPELQVQARAVLHLTEGKAQPAELPLALRVGGI